MSATSLSTDGQAIALVCSSLASQGTGLRPLTAREWHRVSLAVQASTEVERPRDLLGMGAADLHAALEVTRPLAERLAALLARGGQLALEVERLEQQGIWMSTRADTSYPVLLKRRLASTSPPVLFGAGNQSDLAASALAVVGSRDVDADGLEYARTFGRTSAAQGWSVVSGAARGVDSAAMEGALIGGGKAIGVTVDPLERMIRRKDLRSWLLDGSLTLVTPFHPAARWQAGNAMRRNRLIYALSSAAVVVSTAAGSGGTWSGAVENLKARWVPLHVRDDGTAGASELIAHGGEPLSPIDPRTLDLAALTASRSRTRTLLDAAEEAPPTGPAVPGASREAADQRLFTAAWSEIEPFLQDPRTPTQVAEEFGIVTGQARAWLVRAESAGLVRVLRKPRRYLARPDQDGLFDQL